MYIVLVVVCMLCKSAGDVVTVHETLKTACRMITTERERLKRAIEQDCLMPTHNNAAYVQSLKQALTEVWRHHSILLSASVWVLVADSLNRY